MRIEFDPNTPIYLQLTRQIRQEIASGILPPGAKVPSVRDLAVEYGVNPNTVQRALAELERDGLMFAERTAGRFITQDGDRIASVRNELAEQQIERFIGEMIALGYRKDELLKIMTEKWSDQDGHD